jgi:hypothetical protein
VEEEGFMLLDTAVRTELARNFGGVLVVILTVCWRRPKTEPLLMVVPTEN